MVVSFHYTLTGEDGQVIDSSMGGEPLPYLHGHGNIVPGLERQLLGLAIGAKLNAVVPPSEGYGERDDDRVPVVPRGAFPDDIELETGMQFMAQDQLGRVMPLWVTGVDGDEITVDANHPLAGETLHFEVEIVGMRDATAEELAHGHPHGPEGHHHH
jgi:FKBP-type peptidyl-prolyl cis-trans isomerase SlyD